MFEQFKALSAQQIISDQSVQNDLATFVKENDESEIQDGLILAVNQTDFYDCSMLTLDDDNETVIYQVEHYKAFEFYNLSHVTEAKFSDFKAENDFYFVTEEQLSDFLKSQLDSSHLFSK